MFKRELIVVLAVITTAVSFDRDCPDGSIEKTIQNSIDATPAAATGNELAERIVTHLYYSPEEYGYYRKQMFALVFEFASEYDHNTGQYALSYHLNTPEWEEDDSSFCAYHETMKSEGITRVIFVGSAGPRYTNWPEQIYACRNQKLKDRLEFLGNNYAGWLPEYFEVIAGDVNRDILAHVPDLKPRQEMKRRRATFALKSPEMVRISQYGLPQSEDVCVWYASHPIDNEHRFLLNARLNK